MQAQEAGGSDFGIQSAWATEEKFRKRIASPFIPLTRYTEHGQLEADNNYAERCMRPVAGAVKPFSLSAPNAPGTPRLSITA
ncbi:MAG: transposase [Gammaproteobacteria bacterium]|nr:transposase [Gammaproteobacteria bacterium]